MTDDLYTLEPEFHAALSDKDMDEGELRHASIEKIRRISMLAGLTNSSQDLNMICNSNPKEFQEALEFGLASYEHYQNVLRLIESSVMRIYTVAANNPNGKDCKNIDSLEERIANILSSKSPETQH